MEVAGIGGGGLGTGSGAGPAGGATSYVAGAAARAGVPSASATITVGGSLLAGAVPAGLGSLAQILRGYGSAEILFALMLLSAMRKDDAHCSGGGTAGFLAGMALAGQIGRASDIQLHLHIPTETAAGGLGGGLNVLV